MGTPSWSGGREAGQGSARAWNPDAPYAVHRSEGGLRTGDGGSLALLAVTLVSYPILIGGALFPGFPPVLNLLIGGCALGVIAYLQSTPEVGVVAFGVCLAGWPVGLFALGVPVLSPLGAAVILAAALPLGLSMLTALTL